MKLSEFIDKYNGKTVEAGGSANALNQCVDLANQYLKEVLNHAIVLGANAKDFPSRIGTDFEFIKNTPSGIPLPGDLIIWGSPYGKYVEGGKTVYAGHIGIFTDGTSMNFTSFDQNWIVGSPCKLVAHTYTGVLGWLHYKPQGGGTNMDTIPVDKKTFEELVSKSTKYDALAKAGYPTVADVEALQRMKTESDNAAQTANSEAKSTRESFAQYKAQVAEALQCPQDIDRVKSAVAEILAQLDQATKNSKKDSEENAAYEAQIIALKSEVTRLDALLNNVNVLEKVNTDDLLKELYRRLLAILGK